MKGISGTLRENGGFELAAVAEADVATADGCTLAVLHHTRAQLTADELLQAYQRSGPSAVERRSDDCAVVLFDQKTGTLLLARDFAGITPVYYSETSERFAFASRIGDVLASLDLRPAPDLPALTRLLVFNDGPAPGSTCFAGVSSVPPGHMLVRRSAHTEVRNLLDLPRAVEPWSFAEAAAEFGARLERAVERSLPRTGKTAVFVSGGLDSAALACLAARAGDVVGINYGVPDDAAGDESRYLEALRRAGIVIEHVPFYPTIDVASAEQSVRESETPNSLDSSSRCRANALVLEGLWRIRLRGSRTSEETKKPNSSSSARAHASSTCG